MSLEQHSNGAIRSIVGERLRALRRSRGLTQQGLAELAGLSRPTVSTFERGNDVSLDSFLSMLRALDLLDGLEAAVPEPSVSPLGELKRLAGRQRTTSVAAATSEWAWGDER